MIAAGIYTLLLKYQSRQAALAFAFYLVLGSWATAAGRFDLIPAGLTLGAVILATEARWKWAFALLALATLYKFYPVILAVPFFLARSANALQKPEMALLETLVRTEHFYRDGSAYHSHLTLPAHPGHNLYTTSLV